MTFEAADGLLQAGLTHYRSGQLAEAEQLFRRVIAAYPSHPDAIHLLGLIARRAGNTPEAIRLIRAAVAISPTTATYRSNLGMVLLGDDQNEEAVAQLFEATRLQPDYPEALSNLGIGLRRMGRNSEAIVSLRQAVRLRPDMPLAAVNLAALLKDSDQPNEAVPLLRRAVELKPDLVEAWDGLGACLATMGNYGAAVAAYEQAVRLTPDSVERLNNLANVCCQWGDYQTGIKLYRRVNELAPELAYPYSNLGNALTATYQLDAAKEALSKSLELAPDQPETWNNLGNALKDTGEVEQAIGYFRKMVARQPGNAQQVSNLVYSCSFLPGTTASGLLREARQWAEAFEPATVPQFPWPAGRPVRIGYVSPDFRSHVVGRNVLPVLQHHDRGRFRVHLFSNVDRADADTEQFKNAADVWHEVRQLSDEQMASLIRRQRIDILVDLTLHMTGNRLSVFAGRAAPIQVTWAGYPGTTGLSAMDYRITDPQLDPPGTDADYSEKSVRLPQSFWCYRPSPETPDVNPLPAESAGFVTFGCFNNYGKINGTTLDLWAKVLAAVPTAKLRVLSPQGSHRGVAEKRLGVAPGRVTFVDRKSIPEYLAFYHTVDVALDPTPYTGHSTTLDGLWMGVPVVTLTGRTCVSRGSVTPLKILGLDEWVAGDEAAYVAVAAGWAADVSRLANLRRSLRGRMAASPLCDERQFTRDLEAAYLAMIDNGPVKRWS